MNTNRIILMGGSQAGWIIPVISSQVNVAAAVVLSGPTVSVGEEIYYSDFAEHGTRSQAEADQMLGSFGGTKGFDNISFISKMKKPSLWIFGGKDVSIPVKRCIERLDSVKFAEALPIEKRIYPAADHGLFNRDSGRSEDYIPFVIDWLEKSANK